MTHPVTATAVQEHDNSSCSSPRLPSAKSPCDTALGWYYGPRHLASDPTAVIKTLNQQQANAANATTFVLGSFAPTLVSAGVKYLSNILSELGDLQSEECDDGELAPTDWAISKAKDLLVDAAIELDLRYHRPVPRGHVSADSVGGIRIEWVQDDVNVHLVIPANSTINKKFYIYHQHNDESRLEYCPTRDNLAFYLSILK